MIASSCLTLPHRTRHSSGSSRSRRRTRMGCRSVRLSRFRNLLGPEPDLLARVVGLDFGMLLLARHRVSQARLIWCEWVSLGRSKALSQLRFRRSSSDIRRPVEFCAFERQVGKLPDGGNDRERKNELPDWEGACLREWGKERALFVNVLSRSFFVLLVPSSLPHVFQATTQVST